MNTSSKQNKIPDSHVASKLGLFGISTALITPFDNNGRLALSNAIKHVEHVMAKGAAGITLFGTTGEGASIGYSERQELLNALVGSVVATDQVTVCICSSSLEGAVAQATQACGCGVSRLLVTPPFYFNGVTDEGILRWYDQFINALTGYDLQIILYNLPQVTQVELSSVFVRKLKDTFGDVIFGVKDSSGSWDSAASLLQFDDLAILIGDERLLAKAGPLGCAGAISGMANLFPSVLHDLVQSGNENSAVNTLVTDVVCYPVTPLVKALTSSYYGDPLLANVRPPLLPAEVQKFQGMIDLIHKITD